jgi:hypothetical protein
VDAAWLVYTTQSEGQSLPLRLQTGCVMRTAGYEIRIEGRHDDLRVGRTSKDFAESQAEFLKISESFRAVTAQPKK